jgi:hypothetical protein
MTDVIRSSLLLLLVLLSPAVAHAQATIAGTVRDSSGAALPGVTVEAASPALIEKVRTAASDGSGLYRIVNLPPGTYAVSFTLPGFNVIRREGIELSGSFTAQIDGSMTVGGVTETITVSGETPVVDVQSIRRQTTISSEVLTSIPTARSWAATALLIPGIITTGGGPTDVQVTPQMTVFGGAGGRNNEGRRRSQYRRRARRQRRVDVRRGHFQRAGSRDDHLGRSGRGGGGWSDAEHHSEERR